MAKLSEEKKVAPTGETAKRDRPKRPQVSVRSYIEFVTFASQFTRGHKPVRFRGNSWKL